MTSVYELTVRLNSEKIFIISIDDPSQLNIYANLKLERLPESQQAACSLVISSNYMADIKPVSEMMFMSSYVVITL